MKPVIKILLSVNLLLYLFCFSSCNENKDSGGFKTKEDSVAFAKSVAKLYTEVCITDGIGKTSTAPNDTIKLPENLANKEFTDGYFYKYLKNGNLLVSEAILNFNTFNIAAGKSAPVPLKKANDWIGIFRKDLGLTNLDRKQFALSFQKSEIKQLYDSSDCDGFRLYFGRETSNGDISIFLCGFKNDSSNKPGDDLYFHGRLPDGTIGDYVVDDMSKCPSMCPRTVPGSKMLGLIFGQPTGGANPSETDRINP